MNKEEKLNLNAGDYAIRHCVIDQTYNGLEVHKMLCDAYIAGNNDTLDDEDERIRNEIINYFKCQTRDEPSRKDIHNKWIAWLEKQGENCLVNFDEAEKEKYDFVSGQFIECRKSFNGFKEDKSYWLEYIGDDTYIGRSDNILNQKFHITPRQLFTLFTWQHRPKEDCNVNDEANAPTGYGKYVDECLNEAAKHFFSDGEDAYSVADLFYAGVRCGKSWLEKQGVQKVSYTTLVKTGDGGINALVTRELPAEDCDDEQKPVDEAEPKFHIGDKIRIFRKGTANEEPMTITKIDGKGYWSGDLFLCNFTDADRLKLVERKPADKVEPKFKVGDWLVENGVNRNPVQITSFEEDKGVGIKVWFSNGTGTYIEFLKGYHKWTLEDAKDGDVLCYETENELRIFIYKNGHIHYHCCYYNGHLTIVDSFFVIQKHLLSYVHPATKEQRDLLFQKMEEVGYEWDNEKKELKKVKQKSAEWSEEEIEKAAQEWDSKANFNPFYMTMEGDKPTGVKQHITTHKESFKAGVNWILKFLRPQNRCD